MSYAIMKTLKDTTFPFVMDHRSFESEEAAIKFAKENTGLFDYNETFAIINMQTRECPWFRAELIMQISRY